MASSSARRVGKIGGVACLVAAVVASGCAHEAQTGGLAMASTGLLVGAAGVSVATGICLKEDESGDLCFETAHVSDEQERVGLGMMAVGLATAVVGGFVYGVGKAIEPRRGPRPPNQRTSAPPAYPSM